RKRRFGMKLRTSARANRIQPVVELLTVGRKARAFRLIGPSCLQPERSGAPTQFVAQLQIVRLDRHSETLATGDLQHAAFAFNADAVSQLARAAQLNSAVQHSALVMQLETNQAVRFDTAAGVIAVLANSQLPASSERGPVRQV